MLSLVTKSCMTVLGPHGVQPTRLLCPWSFPGKNTIVGCHFLVQRIFPIQGSNLCLLHWQADSFSTESPRKPQRMVCACVLSCFSCVQLFVTQWTIAHQAPLSLGFSRQEYWSGLPCPPPGDIPDPELKLAPFTSPAQAGRFFTASATWEPQRMEYYSAKRGGRHF